jgi:hypothetical protein
LRYNNQKERKKGKEKRVGEQKEVKKSLRIDGRMLLCAKEK